MVPLQFTNTRYFIVKGHLGPDGEYRYPFKVKADAGVRVGGIELAINLTDHTQLIAVGIPTAASSVALQQRAGISGPQYPQQTSSMSATATTSTAPLHLIWKDPVNIWVAEVLTDLRYSWDGLQVSNCAWQDRWERWYGPSGWSRSSGPSYSGPDYNFSNGRYT